MNTFLRIAAQSRQLSRVLLLLSMASWWCLGCQVLDTKSVVTKRMPGRILVLSSDVSIKKYKVAQDEFVKEFGADRVTVVDLGQPQWKKSSRVGEMLYDEYPQVVYCIGTKAYLLANKFIPERQIVFSSTINWRRLPQNEKACGVASEFNPAQQLSYYHNALPEVKKIGVLYSEYYNRQWFSAARKAAKLHGLELVGKVVKHRNQVTHAIEELLAHCDAFWLISDPLVIPTEDDVKTIMSICEKKRVPVLTYHAGFKVARPVMIVSVDAGTVGRQAAGIVNDLLNGEFEGEKILDPIGSSQIFNLKKAKEFDLEYNRDALAIFDEVID